MKIPVKHFVIFMALSIILNGCSVYYKKEVSFNEAFISKKPAKLVSNQNKKLHLKKIILKDGTYYGVYWHKGEEISFPLSKETCRSLRLKNRAASTALNVGGGILTLGVITLFFVAGNNDEWVDFKLDNPGIQFKK